MSYISMSRESMVTLTATLVDEEHADCRALKADPVGAAMWPFIVRVHQRLLTVQRVGPTPERLLQIRKQAKRCDGRHADVLRAIWYACVAAEFMHEQPADKERVRRLRDKLLPDKLAITQLSYRAKVGRAKLVHARLTADDWALLEDLPCPAGGTLADAVRAWFALAAELGALVWERHDAARSQPTQAEVLAARHAWIRAIRALRTALALHDELSPALRSILRRIEEVAARAARRRREPGEPDSTTEPADSEYSASGAEHDPDDNAEPAPDPAPQEPIQADSGTGHMHAADREPPGVRQHIAHDRAPQAAGPPGS